MVYPADAPGGIHARIFQTGGAPLHTVNVAILNTHKEHFCGYIIFSHSMDILALDGLDRHIFPVSTSVLIFIGMSEKQCV
jgi:hypothetical protein